MPTNRAGARRRKAGHRLRCSCAARPPCSAGSYVSTADGNDRIIEHRPSLRIQGERARGYTLQMPTSSYAVHRRSYAKNWDAFFSPKVVLRDWSGGRQTVLPAASHTRETKVAPREGELAVRAHALRCAAPGSLVLRGGW